MKAQPSDPAPSAESAVAPDENDRQTLEVAKLRVEIKEIEARLKYETEKRRIERSKGVDFRTNWLPPIISIIAIVSTVVTVGFTASNFLDQQRRQYAFQMSHDMIVLANQLGSKNQAEREMAAYLLSAFERDAISILMNNLSLSSDAGPTIDVLSSIKSGPHVKSKNDVVEPLIDLAIKKFDTLSLGEEINILVLKNYVQALGFLAQEDSARAVRSLVSLRERIGLRKPNNGINDVHYYLLRKEIDRACNNLIGRSC